MADTMHACNLKLYAFVGCIYRINAQHFAAKGRNAQHFAAKGHNAQHFADKGRVQLPLQECLYDNDKLSSGRPFMDTYSRRYRIGLFNEPYTLTLQYLLCSCTNNGFFSTASLVDVDRGSYFSCVQGVPRVCSVVGHSHII